MPTKMRTYRQMQIQQGVQRQKQHPRITFKPKQISPSLLGYDRAWYALAKAYRQAHPLCEHCESRGMIVASQETDHIIPFHGLSDPLRIDWDNLQALCKPCHSRKTAKEDGGFGRAKRTPRQEQTYG